MDKIYWIVIVNLALYLKTLRFKFVSDDFAVYQQMKNTAYKNWLHKRWLQFMGVTKLMGRSIVFHKGKFHAIPTEEQEHLIALLIHTAICIMIYLAFGTSTISFVAALLYSTNPANNQGTIWPGGRGYALPILCLLISIAFPVLSPLTLTVCSSFTIGFLAPLALIGSPVWYLLALMPIVWWIHSKKYTTAIKFKAGQESFDEDKLSFHPKKFIILIKTLGFYLTLCIIPFRITFYHNFLQSMSGSLKHKAQSPFCRYFLIGVLFLAGFTAYAILTPWNNLTWALFAFLITILPFCNFVRANQEIAERFCALPNVFLMYALAQMIAPHNVIVTAFIIFYATRTYYTINLYKDEYFITECAVIEDPHAWWAWHCRAMKRWDTQSYKEALTLWVMAKIISPKEFKILMNIATCLRLLKNNKEADAFLRLAEENIVAGQEKDAMEFIRQHRAGKLPILL